MKLARWETATMSVQTGQPDSISTIAPEELGRKLRAGVGFELIDVRTPAEFRALRATPARLIPLDQLDAAALVAERGVDADEPLYVICQKGGRAAKACERLRAAGCTNVVNVEGGTLAWDRAGLPVVRGKKSMALDRQVRIAAGSLVLLGVALGFALHPAFFGLSGFVGAGLVFSGITDTCGMAMFLARMPWNRVSLDTRCEGAARS